MSERKDCLDCKHSYCEDLYGELCCKLRNRNICPHELKWITENGKEVLDDIIYYPCEKFEQE